MLRNVTFCRFAVETPKIRFFPGFCDLFYRKLFCDQADIPIVEIGKVPDTQKTHDNKDMQKRLCGLSPLHVSLESPSQLFSLECFPSFSNPSEPQHPRRIEVHGRLPFKSDFCWVVLGMLYWISAKSLNFSVKSKKRMSDSGSKLPTRHVFH